MKEGNIRVITDDKFLAKGIISLLRGAPASAREVPPVIMVIDTDRVRDLKTLEGLVQHLPPSAVVTGINRNGLMSRLLMPVSHVCIDAPLPLLLQTLSAPPHAGSSRSFWLSRCHSVMNGKMLSGCQASVLAGYQRGLDLHAIARRAGISPKTCYTHVRSICTRLNLRNLTEVRVFATLLLEEQRTCLPEPLAAPEAVGALTAKKSILTCGAE